MYCFVIASVKRLLLLQCSLTALACCIVVPETCSGDDGRAEAFLDAQELVDGWATNYGHIDPFKVRCSRVLLDEKGQNPIPQTRIQFFLEERTQDGRKFLVRQTRSPQGFDDTDDYVVNSFDGSIGKEYYSDLSGRNQGRGSIYRGLRGRGYHGMPMLGLFLETVPLYDNKPASPEGPHQKAKSHQQYLLGIPPFIERYNRALRANGVLVRPYLESVAGESCHVLEFYFSHGDDAFWLAHEKGMLLMKKKYESTERKRVSSVKKITTEEVKEIASVKTDKGILWYPRVITDERITQDYSYTTKVTVHEFVPYVKAPPERFSYVFPDGTRVYDTIKDLRYTVGQGETTTKKAPIELKSMYSGPVTDEITLLLQERDNESDGHGVLTNSVGMKLILIKPGSLVMGSDSGLDNEKPAHKVTLTKPFYIGVFEVTQQQYEKVMGTNPSRVKGPRRPVETVSWDEAQDFCQRLSETESRSYRLPTEAEWEYACRSGTDTKYYWSDEPDGRYAWTGDNSSDAAHDVGTRLPNAWGLHDMSGNVSEWCADWYDAQYPGRTSQSDPRGPSSGQSRVVRGGCWYDAPRRCRSAHRYGGAPDLRGDDIGFRIVLDLN